MKGEGDALAHLRWERKEAESCGCSLCERAAILEFDAGFATLDAEDEAAREAARLVARRERWGQ
jgi:hypothetical protein